MNDTLFRGLSRCLGAFGLMPAIRSLCRRGGLIVYFHEILDDRDGGAWCRERSLVMKRSLFEEWLTCVRKHFEIVTLDEAAREGAPGTMALTFDDGYRGVYDNAFPILRSTKATATVFLTTDFIGTSRLAWWDRLLAQLDALRELPPDRRPDVREALPPAWRARLRDDGRFDPVLTAYKFGSEEDRRELAAALDRVFDVPEPAARIYLSLDEIRDMRSHGIGFGSHTRRHPVLTWLDDAALKDELAESKRVVDGISGGEACWFAYPDGLFTDREEAAVRASGYVGAVQTFRHPGKAGVFAVPRLAVKEREITDRRARYSPAMFELKSLRHRLRRAAMPPA